MIHRVGMADARATGGNNSLRTLGLGSCVGVALYDASAKVAGLVHIMLPQSSSRGECQPAKYADTGIPYLLRLMSELGAEERRIVAKLAGGAQMFANTGNLDSMRIGPRNVEAVEAALALRRIPILATAVGGSQGRTVELFGEDGRLSIRSVLQSESFI